MSELKPMSELSPAELLAGLERAEPKNRGDLFVEGSRLLRHRIEPDGSTLNTAAYSDVLGDAALIRALVTREQAHCEAVADVLGALEAVLKSGTATITLSEDSEAFGRAEELLAKYAAYQKKERHYAMTEDTATPPAILPCPNPGCKNSFTVIVDNQIRCANCGMRGPAFGLTGRCKNLTEAAAAWNALCARLGAAEELYRALNACAVLLNAQDDAGVLNSNGCKVLASAATALGHARKIGVGEGKEQ